MTDVSAALGLAQLERYEKILERRREIIGIYDSELLPLGLKSLEHYGDNFSSSGHLYLLRMPGVDELKRNEIILRMSKDGVPCNVHYKPLPMFTAYKNLGFDINDYPNAYNQYKNEISLPLHTLLYNEDLNYVIKILNKILK
jgi:dTDP-4-amino-4,6-dideoxygalactose transaminase